MPLMAASISSSSVCFSTKSAPKTRSTMVLRMNSILGSAWTFSCTTGVARKASRPEGQRRQARAGKDPVGAADLAAIQQHLEDFLGLKVTIQPDSDPTTGAVTIRYKNLDQLDLICQRLTGGEF